MKRLVADNNLRNTQASFQGLFFPSGSHRAARLKEEEEKGLSHRSLTWTALLKGDCDVTDTSLLSLSSPLQLARWQEHAEKRDNELPSPLFIFPVSLSHPVPFLSLPYYT